MYVSVLLSSSCVVLGRAFYMLDESSQCTCVRVLLLSCVVLWQAFYMLDELLVGGEIQESSKKNIIRAVTAQDVLQEVSNWENVSGYFF